MCITYLVFIDDIFMDNLFVEYLEYIGIDLVDLCVSVSHLGPATFFAIFPPPPTSSAQIFCTAYRNDKINRYKIGFDMYKIYVQRT